MSVKNKVNGGLLTFYSDIACYDSNRVKTISDESTLHYMITHLTCELRNIDDFGLNKELTKILKEMKKIYDRRYA